jgi:hypothetical protein
MLDPNLSDPIDIPPTVAGEHGRAWRADLAAGLREKGIDPADNATLDHWIIEAPFAHPHWHSYSIVLVHLRPMPDNRDTKFYLDGATHEMWIYALNPERPRRHLIETGIVAGEWLSPGNFAAQFIEVADDLAQARIYAAVVSITRAELSPDPDYVRWWGQLFGTNMLKRGAGETRIVIGDTELLIPPVEPPRRKS